MNLLIADIQPNYIESSQLLLNIQDIILDSAEILVTYNNFAGKDTKNNVFNYITDNNELVKQKLQHATFIQKEFGIFRNMIQALVPDNTIIEILQVLYSLQLYDFMDVKDISVFSESTKSDIFKYRQGITLPDYTPMILLKNLSPFYLIGGNSISSIEIICKAFDIQYKRIDSLIY
jgi:hypothetical protein